MTIFWTMLAWGCIGALSLSVAAIYVMFDKIDTDDRDFFSQQAISQERWDFLAKKREEEK